MEPIPFFDISYNNFPKGKQLQISPVGTKRDVKIVKALLVSTLHQMFEQKTITKYCDNILKRKKRNCYEKILFISIPVYFRTYSQLRDNILI
jgi:hypothetical protein